MFKSFKYDPETREVQEIRNAFDPVTARSSQHQACNNCHAKKLRCSGEKSGCERCVAAQLTCEYTRSNSRSSRRGKNAATPGNVSPSSRHHSGPSSPLSSSNYTETALRQGPSRQATPTPLAPGSRAFGGMDPAIVTPSEPDMPHDNLAVTAVDDDRQGGGDSWEPFRESYDGLDPAYLSAMGHGGYSDQEFPPYYAGFNQFPQPEDPEDFAF